MRLTKNVISKQEAIQLAPDYVEFVEGNFDKYEAVEKEFSKLRVGQKVLTYDDGVYVIAKVSKVDHNDPRAVDGPIVRVSNGEYSWRVDGDRYAYPLK